ncbi:MAG: hypothetical protein AAF840_10845, partial [Bacteroidota bacterium]
MPNRFLLLMLALFPAILVPQNITLTPEYPTVRQNGRAIPLAWFGGLNTPQTQAVDLDGDGINDLYFFDKAGEIHLAMKGDG